MSYEQLKRGECDLYNFVRIIEKLNLDFKCKVNYTLNVKQTIL